VPRAVPWCHVPIFVIRLSSLPLAHAGSPPRVLAPPNVCSDSQFYFDASQLPRSVLLTRQGFSSSAKGQLLPPILASAPRNLCCRILFSLLLVVLSPWHRSLICSRAAHAPGFQFSCTSVEFSVCDFLGSGHHFVSGFVVGTSGGFHGSCT
jgi:hypothetical protein